MKIHQYYLNSAPWWIINGNLKPMDVTGILFVVGRAFGISDRIAMRPLFDEAVRRK